MSEHTVMIPKIAKYIFLAEPFHCDLTHHLFMGHLGNHLLNAADMHSTERGFGMNYLNPIHKTWVLSRLAIEMYAMPRQYERFNVETWVEGAMRFFTQRNFRIADEQGTALGYGRSVWAMIDTDDRKPQDILAIRDGAINDWIETGYDCPIAKAGRVKMGENCEKMRTIDTYYHDVDVNGHINSIKYIEHILDLFSPAYYQEHRISRLDVAYVAESHAGEPLTLYMERLAEEDFNVKIVKESGTEVVEVCRCNLIFEKI